MICMALASAIGVWLMFAPAALDYGGGAAIADRVVGPILATLAWVSAADCTRGLKRSLFPLGAWLLVAPLALGSGVAAAVSSVASGALVIALAWGAGPARGSYGGGWSAIWRQPDDGALRSAGAPY